MATNAKNLAEYLNNETTSATADIADGSITAAKLASNAVTTAKINADAITNAKIADDVIGPENIAGTVPFGHRNLLINGDFQEWQRGTSGTVNTYTCDRWYGWGNQHALTQQQAENGTHNSGRFALRVAHNDGTSNTFSSIAQTLETRDAAQCRGKKVTFSIDVKKGSAFTGNLTLQIVTRTDQQGSINTGTRQVLVTEDITSSLTTSLQRFTCTTSTVCAQNIRVIGVNVNHTGTSGTDANNNFQVERAQLEIGEHATPFETTNASDNLARCYRYYFRQNMTIYDVYAMGHVNSTNKPRLLFPLPVPMRALPTITKGADVHYLWYNAGGSVVQIHNPVRAYMNSSRTEITTVYIDHDASGTIANSTYPIALTTYHGSGTANSYYAFESEF